MRVAPLFFFFVLTFLFFYSERSFAQPAVLGDYPKITAGLYAFFLESVAKDDPHGLYDGKMELPTTIPHIFRLGTPGNYCYMVSEEEENLPLFYLNAISVMRCCNWLENRKFFGDQNKEPAFFELTETGVYDLEQNYVYSLNEQSTYFLVNEEGYEWNPFEEENSDLSLISSHLNFSIGSVAPQSDIETTTELTAPSSSLKNFLPKKHPLTRKALKIITVYFCPVIGACLGAGSGGLISNYLDCDLILSIGLAGGGILIGLVAGIIVTDVVWSKLNSWLGPPCN